MPTILTHALAGASLAQVLAPGGRLRAVTSLAAVTAMLPDADVIGFRLGIPYGDMFGHRGLTHSLLFACVVGLVVAVPFWAKVTPAARLKIIVCIAVATASHGFLDAFTDGGRGVAFFTPFDATRYFFPVTPIEVSPLGIQAIFSRRGVSVLASELVWVWIPALVVAASAIAVRRTSRTPP